MVCERVTRMFQIDDGPSIGQIGIWQTAWSAVKE